MFAELLGKEAGYCRGKGGSMHIADQQTGNLGANAIVGGSAGIATGAAMSAQMRGSGQVAVCFFGEGALGQGLLYEVMNMASLWKLPVVYVCENNLYNEYTHYRETTAGSVTARAEAFGIPAETVDGQDVRAVHAAALEAVERARRGDGPASSCARPTATTATTSATSTARTTAPARRRRRWRDERDPIAAARNVAARAGSRERRRPGRDRDARARRRRGGCGVRARRSLSRRDRGRPACLRLAPPPSRVRAAASAS